MYDELVKRLHKRIALTTAGSPLQDDLKEAADAIEELSRENESLEKDVEIASYVMARRWIPVTERLPKDGAPVLTYGTTHWMPLPKPPEEE